MMQRRKVVGAMVTPPGTQTHAGLAQRHVTFESQAAGGLSEESQESQPAQRPDDGSELSEKQDEVARADPSMTLDISRDEGATLGYSCPPSIELRASDSCRVGGGSDSDSDESDEELGSTFLPTQRQDVRDRDDDDGDDEDDKNEDRDRDGEGGNGEAILSEESAQKGAPEQSAVQLESAAFSEADAGSLSSQLKKLQEHRTQRASDKRNWETMDSDLAERIAALIAERGETQRRWVSSPSAHVLV